MKNHNEISHQAKSLIENLNITKHMKCNQIFNKVFDHLDDNEDGQIPRSILSSIADDITSEICLHFNVPFHSNEW